MCWPLAVLLLLLLVVVLMVAGMHSHQLPVVG
jgi:hypothetical protein